MMEKEDLLFYREYEEFYTMAKQSKAFEAFCRDAFGQDFSQDGFSDVAQIDMILKYIPQGEDVHILDVGCGNGKMLKYLQESPYGKVHGFDGLEDMIAHFERRCALEERIITEVLKEDCMVLKAKEYRLEEIAYFLSC